MSGSLRLASAMACALCAPTLCGQSGDIAELFAKSRYDLALEATHEMSDSVLAAEWRVQILDAAGDFPGALAAARAGLARDPDNLRLYQNGANLALTLGDGVAASELCERWRGAIERVGPAEQRPSDLARVERFERDAAQLLSLEQQAQAATTRARWISLALLAASLAALVRLMRR